MRSLFVGIMSATLAACGIFGATETTEPAKPEETQPPPSTPEENSQPPGVTGEAPVGVYVSSSLGQDDGSGSAVRPLKSLRRAFELARDQKLRVIACAEVYAENIDIIDGVSAYGYYDCSKAPWAKGTARAVVKAPNSPAAVARLIVQPTRIEGFELRAPDLDGVPATDTTGTSIALEVRTSSGLVISDSLLHGGKGAPGSDGSNGQPNSRTNASSSGSNAFDQHERACTGAFAELCSKHLIEGPAGGTTTCAIGPSGGAGGQGGDGRDWLTRMPSDVPGDQRGRPFAATAATAVGGLNTDANGGGQGLPGGQGASGAEGPDGTNGVWSFTTAGFVRGSGTEGGPGLAGQGGGGGAGTGGYWVAGGVASPPAGSNNYATATGGSGGGGGCGGQAGKPATGGGASVGALVIDSGVTFDHARIESANGGRGGLGNLGTPGIAGGAGGLAPVYGKAGRGGDGGYGGNGGASGHGAPGPSIALVYSGTKPVLTEADLAPGPAGAGQPELKRSVGGAIGFKTLPAVVGESKAEHQIK